MMAKSSAYAAVLSWSEEVLNVYPRLSRWSQRIRGSRKMMNRYGLRVSPWIVPRSIWTGLVVPKCSPEKEVVELVYMLPIS